MDENFEIIQQKKKNIDLRNELKIRLSYFNFNSSGRGANILYSSVKKERTVLCVWRTSIKINYQKCIERSILLENFNQQYHQNKPTQKNDRSVNSLIYFVFFFIFAIRKSIGHSMTDCTGVKKSDEYIKTYRRNIVIATLSMSQNQME